ncbi:MAG TPA: DoxX family protein [Longimicrobiales bacterium]|nr:DoxX family protein [Longimicrobiales bacterium]
MMEALDRRLARFGGPAHAILRIGAALLFLQHGVMKLFGWLGGVDGAGGTVELMSIYGLAGVIEVFGSILLAIGLFTRPVAAIAFVEMLAAYAIAHMPQGGFPVQNQGELALLFALVWLFIATNGPGPWSVDRRLAHRGTTRTVT